MSKEFVHLHMHSEYSALDGLGSIQDMVDTVKAHGAPAVGVTDHGSMGGSVKLVEAARDAGIKPIIGLEAYHVPDRHVKAKLEDGKANWHLILLAENETGYLNLLKLSSIANTEGKYGKWGRVDDDLLSQYSEGIIATTACLGSRVNQALLAGDRDGALEFAKAHRDIFGKDNYFVEVQDHGMPDQHRILDDQVWLAEQLGVGLLATNDCHYLHDGDHNAHDILLKIGTGSTVNDPDAFKFESDQHYIKTPEEMWKLFPEDKFPGACQNTVEIANRVDFDLDMETLRFPDFDVPAEFDSAEEYLRHIVYENAAQPEMYGNDDGIIPERVQERLEYELDIISSMGFPGYFLVLSDIVTWGKNQGIKFGPGRGSGAGSAVVYCCRITGIDPLQHGLYFERFLNPGRLSMPDIDIDIEPDRREEVINYAVQRYGKDRVARIMTYSRLKSRSAIKDVVRVMEKPVSVANNILSQYPPDISQVQIPIKVASLANRADVPDDWASQWEQGSAFRKALKRDYETRNIVDVAKSIEWNVRQTGIHAGGIVITPGPLSDFLPYEYDKEKELYASAYDMVDLEKVGGVKFDFLGLTTLSMIQRTLYLIQSDMNQRIDIDRIPIDDPAPYRMLANGETDGVFQLSSGLATDVITRIQPTSFKDISAAIALGRPGPMDSDMHIEYAERKNGRKPVKSFHPDMSELLSEEYGLPFYQENIMALAQRFAGYTAADADKFRKAMGKKSKDVMDEQEGHFIQGVLDQGHKKALADQLWEIIKPFSGYAFNKAHSVAYGMISYQTAWLKAHYPTQFAAATIDITNNADEIPKQIDACRRKNIHVYGPDINNSLNRARTSRDSIWLGLSGIKSVGAAVNPIILERNASGEYESLGDFLVRTRGKKVNITAVRNLISVGAFDALHKSRRSMVDNLQDMLNDATNIANEDEVDMDNSLFDFSDDIESAIDSYELDGKDYSRQEKSKMEMEILGFFVGKHPFAEYADRIEDAKESNILPRNAVNPGEAYISRDVSVYGILTNLEVIKKKGKNPRSEFVIETGYDSRLQAIIFGKSVDPSYQGHLVLAKGMVREDSFRESLDGSPIISMVVNELDPVEMGHVKKRTRLKVIKGEADEGSDGPDERVVNLPSAEDRPKRRRSSSRGKVPAPEPVAAPEVEAKTASSYRFTVSSQMDLQTLSELLNSYGQGDVQVIIHYQGQDVKHDQLKFDLNDEKVQYISDQIGIEYTAV